MKVRRQPVLSTFGNKKTKLMTEKRTPQGGRKTPREIKSI